MTQPNFIALLKTRRWQHESYDKKIGNFHSVFGVTVSFPSLCKLNWSIFPSHLFSQRTRVVSGWSIYSAKRSIRIVSYRYTDFMPSMWKCIYSIRWIFCHLQSSIRHSSVSKMTVIVFLTHTKVNTLAEETRTRSIMFNFRLLDYLCKQSLMVYP